MNDAIKRLRAIVAFSSEGRCRAVAQPDPFGQGVCADASAADAMVALSNALPPTRRRRGRPGGGGAAQVSIPTFSVNAIVEQLKKDPRFSMIPRGAARLESLRLDYQVRAPIAPAHTEYGPSLRPMPCVPQDSGDRTALVDGLKALAGAQLLKDAVKALSSFMRKTSSYLAPVSRRRKRRGRGPDHG